MIPKSKKCVPKMLVWPLFCEQHVPGKLDIVCNNQKYGNESFWKKLHSSQVRQQTRRSCEFVTLAFSTVWKKFFKKKWVQNLLTSQSSCQKMALALHAKEVTLLKKCLSEIKFEISSNSFFKIVFLLTCIQNDKFDQRQEQSQPRDEIHSGVKSYACV